MCGNCKSVCSGGCVANVIAKILVIIGGINWGLIGIGMLLGKVSSWNVVNLALGSIPLVEGIVYLLVGISAIVLIFGCKCGKCKETCCSAENKQETGPMQ